jgi:DNA (cytosine-5)-methyltransferase 1
VRRLGVISPTVPGSRVYLPAGPVRGKFAGSEAKMLTFGSLFSGIGGIDLGLERAGMVCRWQVEIDDYATRVLEKHWPDVARFRDVRECGAHNLAAVDVIAGGFPCQDISSAGKRAGIGGERSGLWSEYARIVRELRPRYVVVENVSTLLNRGIDIVLGDLAACGYDAEWQSLPAAAFGAPHIRDRVFVLAYAKSDGWGEGRAGRSAGRGANREDEPQEVLDHANGKSLVWSAKSRSERDSWATEPAVGRVADGVPNRVDRLRGLGNAVVPQVAEFVGRCIMAAETERTR